MIPTVDQIIDDILKKEGGYNDIKEDRGGATNLGVSLRYAKSVPEMDLDGDGDIDKFDIMMVTPEIARRLYKRDFFYGPGIDTLPPQLHPQLFDISVNSGGRRAIKLLQMTLNEMGMALKVDGYSGPATEDAAARAVRMIGWDQVNNRLVQERIDFYEAIIHGNPSQAKFRKGWMKRARSFIA